MPLDYPPVILWMPTPYVQAYRVDSVEGTLVAITQDGTVTINWPLVEEIARRGDRGGGAEWEGMLIAQRIADLIRNGPLR